MRNRTVGPPSLASPANTSSVKMPTGRAALTLSLKGQVQRVIVPMMIAADAKADAEEIAQTMGIVAP